MGRLQRARRIVGIPLGGGFRRFDGTDWLPVPGPVGEDRFAVTDLVSASDGSVWASILLADAAGPGESDGSRSHLARWDGEAWTSYEWPAWMRRGQRSPVQQMEAGPDGAIWFEWPFMSFDGETWTRYQIPARATSPRPRIDDLSVTPDGSIWIIVRDLIKFGTSRPDGIYVIDPSQTAVAETAVATRRHGQEQDAP